MANTIIVVDEADSKLGSFFQICLDDLNVFFNNINIQPTLLNSVRLNELSVQLTTLPLETFVFGAYSHGGKNCLVKANASYVSTTINNDILHCTLYTITGVNVGDFNVSVNNGIFTIPTQHLPAGTYTIGFKDTTYQNLGNVLFIKL